MTKDEQDEQEAQLIAKLAMARRAKLLEILAATADSQRTLIPALGSPADLVGPHLAG